jgi:hypothetical protein
VKLALPPKGGASMRRPYCIQIRRVGIMSNSFRMYCGCSTMLEYGLSEGNNAPLSELTASNVTQKAIGCARKFFLLHFARFHYN